MLNDFYKIDRTCHGAFFAQHPKSNIVFFETSYGIERIELHKGGNIKPRIMRKL
jgi:hypothetical protein